MTTEILFESRRSCRAYNSDPVSEGQLHAILTAGQWAPSPLNLQPWEFIIVDDPETKTRIRKAAETARQAVIDNGGPGWAAKYDLTFLEEAPLMIAVAADPSKGGLGDYFGQEHGAIQAAAACIQNMMLAASQMALGSLWFTFYRPDELKAILQVPERLALAGLVLFGTPKKPVPVPPRKDPIVHRRRYQAKS